MRYAIYTENFTPSQFTKEIIFSTTAEGIGSTEADDIRQAITRALDALFVE